MDISASQAVTLRYIQHMRARPVKNSDISCNSTFVPPTSIRFLLSFLLHTIGEGLLAVQSNKNNKERGGEHIQAFHPVRGQRDLEDWLFRTEIFFIILFTIFSCKRRSSM